MTLKQLLQYYMWHDGDVSKYCKHSKWDGYFYDCPHSGEHGCLTCKDWDPDLDEAIKDAEEDIAKYHIEV